MEARYVTSTISTEPILQALTTRPYRLYWPQPDTFQPAPTAVLQEAADGKHHYAVAEIAGTFPPPERQIYATSSPSQQQRH